MAAPSIDPKIIKKTQEALGPIIKKPPLTEKHLSKPPFRYLHDMLMEINRSTGFFKGLYSGKELDGKREWSRDDKIAFFQKAIDVLGWTTGNISNARPSKIIAGAEPDKTNEFLQLIAKAISEKKDSSQGIEKVLKGEKPSAQKPPTDKSSTDKPSSDKTPSDKKAAKEVKKEVSKQEQPELLAAGNSGPLEEPPPVTHHERPQHRPGTRRKHRSDHNESDVNKELPVKKESDGLSSDGSGGGSQVHLIERPSTAKGQRKKSIDNGHQQQADHVIPKDRSPSPVQAGAQTELIPLTTRPSSARPPAPRVLKKVARNEEIASQRVDSGQDRKPPNVILDHQKHGDDNEEDEYEALPIAKDIPAINDQLTAKPEGALTKTLMAVKEKYKGEQDDDVSSQSVMITEAQRKKERELVQKEVSILQASIQSLCQTANPLGKIMDYVQEDVDSMEQELAMWKEENLKYTEVLRREEKITEDEVAPLKAQLAEINAKINEQYDIISASKATILKNDKHIKQTLLLLSSQ